MSEGGEDQSMVGRAIGPYTVLRPLAKGGMAQVFIAARPSPAGAELFAIKRVLPHLTWDPEFVRMFLEEVRIVTHLVHPNIVRVLDYGTGEGGYYLAMEYLHGQTVSDVLKALEGVRLPLQVALGVVADVADGLDYAHHYRSVGGSLSGIVHRDVSPANVMLGYDGVAKLLDFGIASITSRTKYTKVGTTKGKAGYMAPEQCSGDAVHPRTDVFGLGILLYELSLGRRAFFGASEFEVIGRTLSGTYVAPQKIDPGFPAEISRTIARALSVSANDRHPSAAAFAEELRRFAAGAGLDLGVGPRARVMQNLFGAVAWPHVPPDLGPMAPPPRPAPSTRLPWRAIGGAAGAVVLLTAGYVIGSLDREPGPGVVPPRSGALEAVSAPVEAVIETPTVVPRLEEDPPPSADIVAPAAEPTPATDGDARPWGAEAFAETATGGATETPEVEPPASAGATPAEAPGRSSSGLRRSRPTGVVAPPPETAPAVESEPPPSEAEPEFDPNVLLPPSRRR